MRRLAACAFALIGAGWPLSYASAQRGDIPSPLQSVLADCEDVWTSGVDDVLPRLFAEEEALPEALAGDEQLQAAFLSAVQVMLTDAAGGIVDWHDGVSNREELEVARAVARATLTCAERLLDAAFDLVPVSERLYLGMAQLRTSLISARFELGPAEEARRSVERADAFLQSYPVGSEPAVEYARMRFRYQLTELLKRHSAGCSGERCDLSLVAAEESVRIARDGLRISQEVAAGLGYDPVSGARDALAGYLADLGAVRQARGETALALDAYDESLSISRELAAIDPDRYGGLSGLLTRIADARFEQGDVTGSFEAYDEALSVSRASVDRYSGPYPDTVRERLWELVNEVAGLRLAHGFAAEALAGYEEAVAIQRELVERYNEDEDDLAESLAKLADIRLEQGLADEALAAYDESLALTRATAERSRWGGDWTDALAAEMKIGMVRERLGDLAGAEELFRAGHERVLRMIEADPADPSLSNVRREFEQAIASVTGTPPPPDVASPTIPPPSAGAPNMSGGQVFRHGRGREGQGIGGAAASADWSRVLTWSDEGLVRLWNAATGEQTVALAYGGLLAGAAFSPDGSRVVTWGRQGARLWSAKTGEPELALRHTDESRSRTYYQGVSGVAFTDDGGRIVTWSNEGGDVRLWDAATGAQIGPPLVYGRYIDGAAFSADETRLLLWGGRSWPEPTVRLWDATTGEPIGAEIDHVSKVLAAVFTDDPDTIRTWAEDGRTRLWDVATGAEVGAAAPHEEGADGAAITADRSRVLTWRIDGTARLRDATTHERIGAVMAHGRRIYRAVLSADGQLIITRSDEGPVRLWDAAGVPVGMWRGGETIFGALFSADGSRILTWGGDEAQLWDAPRGAGTP